MNWSIPDLARPRWPDTPEPWSLGTRAARGPGIHSRRAALDGWRGEHRVDLLLVLVGADVVLPRVIQSLTTPKFRRSAGIDYGGYTAAAAMAQDVLRIAIVAICAVLIIDSIRTRRPLRIRPFVVFLAPWTYMVVRDLWVHAHPSIDALLLPVVVFALWAARPALSCLRTLAHLTIGAAVISMAMAVVDPPSALFRSDQGALIVEEKQIIPSGMLAGFLTQPNNLGQFIVLGMPALFLLRSRWLRLVYFLIGAFTIVWTASRTSLYALTMMCLAAALLWLTRGHGARRNLSTVMIAIPFAAVCALPLVTTDPSAYSERGFIWQASLPAWYSSPWFGQGANWYRDLATTSGSIASSAFQGHNQVVQLLVTGGLLYAILTGAMILMASSRAVRLAGRGVNYGVIYLVALAGTCLLEVSLVTVDNSSMFPVVVVPLTVILFSRPTHARRWGADGSRNGTAGTVLPRVFVTHDTKEAEYDA